MIRSVVLCITVAVGVGCSGLEAADAPVAPTREAREALGAAKPATLVLPGDNYFPESITASLGGAFYVASITTGEIVRFAAPGAPAKVFVPPGVNLGTAGVAFDDVRQVLWACAVDLTFSTPTALRAFSARDGALIASYTVPDGGVCGDITLARNDVYITDTLLGLLFKLTTPAPWTAAGGALALWSADPAFRGAGFLQINGIAFDGAHTLYTTNYSTGELLRVAIQRDGTAGPAAVIQTPRAFTRPDGIRIAATFVSSLFVTENTGALSRVDIAGDAATIVALGTFDQPTSVIRVGGDLWVAEGQDLRLQGVDPTPLNLPFVIRRLSL
jgi:sugar lactone lactonase YvrE